MSASSRSSTTPTDQPPPDPVPATMRAVVQDRYGSVDTLSMAEVAVPTAAADEVLVEVHAAGVDRGTHHLMTGTPYLMRVIGFGVTRPKQAVPGLDVAGRVVAVGDEVTRFAVGDEVFGVARGSFAEYAVAAERKLSHKPATSSFVEAAVVAVSGMTALQGLTEVGTITAGQRVLVIGASGGVGSFAVQLAVAEGASVTGVASAAKADLVRRLGAAEVIDYAAGDYLDGSRTWDLILDIGGRNPVRHLRRALTPTGTLVLVGGEGGEQLTGGMGRALGAIALSPFVSQRLRMFVSTEHHRYLDRLAEHLTDGSVVPAVGGRYGLDEVPRAIDDLASGRAAGKSVIVVREDQP